MGSVATEYQTKTFMEKRALPGSANTAVKQKLHRKQCTFELHNKISWNGSPSMGITRL